MSTKAQEESPFDLDRATYRAAQTTVWLHTLMGDASQRTEKKQEAVHHAIVSSQYPSCAGGSFRPFETDVHLFPLPGI